MANCRKQLLQGYVQNAIPQPNFSKVGTEVVPFGLLPPFSVCRAQPVVVIQWLGECTLPALRGTLKDKNVGSQLWGFLTDWRISGAFLMVLLEVGMIGAL